MNKLWLFILFPVIFFTFYQSVNAQSIKSLEISTSMGLGISSCILTDNNKIQFEEVFPLFSFVVDDSLINSLSSKAILNGEVFNYEFSNGIIGFVSFDPEFGKGWKAFLTVENNSMDTVDISNVVPLGQSEDHIYLTASGSWSLARTKIFRPGLGPIGVILPDNAWEMGYSAIQLNDQRSLCAIARRSKINNSERQRYKTIVPPGGFIEYTLYADIYNGEWQNGLKMMFQERYLYDLEEFDNTLYERQDLQWIRDKYIIILQFAWDHNYYDPKTGKYNFYEFLEKGKKLFGGYDIFGIWPTWPTLGMDQRNQWDMYEDLPWGLEKMKDMAEYAQTNSTRFFIAFNPWDQSTRKEDPYKGMARLIEATNADGVVLDTQGSSSEKLQNSADSIKPGVIMYSEGMAVPKDMPGIVSGRVHDAIFMPPPLNLNKLIKPEFAIFRVCQLSEGRIHRETAISFFNGIGTEINTFAPGRPAWMEEEFLYLGRTTKILRENSSAFISKDWTPLIPSLMDSIWVNKWPAHDKTIYTIFSLIPEGFNGLLFEAQESPNHHFVSLWHHEEVKVKTKNNKTYLPSTTRAFNKAWLNTRREGNLDCIARFPNLLNVKLKGDSLIIHANKGTKIVVWTGIPSYQGTSKEFPVSTQNLKLIDIFGRYEGKFVIQLFNEKELLDERVVTIEPGTPRLISVVEKTETAKKPPKNMVEVPKDTFIFKAGNEANFIPYPDNFKAKTIKVNRFFMDKYPVRNKQFYSFIEETNYTPRDKKNFLKHWKNGIYPRGQGNYPVVYVSLENAKAYAKWAGKRLPTEIEWQYAAQGTDGRLWPWGNDFQGTKCNNAFDQPTPVDAFPKGKSPFKVEDMVGNVWQLTNDVYDNGSYQYVIIRGGSYYKPTSSRWYVQGGPQQLDKRQMLLMISPGFNRNATVGFRCVKDAQTINP